jgi:hypothetical protein
MFKKLLVVCAFALAATACLDVPSDEDLTEEEQDLDVLAPPTSASCATACPATTSTCTTDCLDAAGYHTTCAAYEGSCDLMLERKAREGRNPQTGETIQIPPRTGVKR